MNHSPLGCTAERVSWACQIVLHRDDSVEAAAIVSKTRCARKPALPWVSPQHEADGVNGRGCRRAK